MKGSDSGRVVLPGCNWLDPDAQGAFLLLRNKKPLASSFEVHSRKKIGLRPAVESPWWLLPKKFDSAFLHTASSLFFASPRF